MSPFFPVSKRIQFYFWIILAVGFLVPTAYCENTRQFILVNRKLHLKGQCNGAEAVSQEDFMEVKRALPDQSKANIRVGIGFIFSYFRTENDACLIAALQRVLDLAEQTDTPVIIQLDGENWWDARPVLWNWWDASLPGFDPKNRDNVEWSSWDSDDALKIAWRNWGKQLRVRPPPNLMSPRYREACHEKMKLMIPIILKWWKALPNEKKELLVGIKVGWEASIGVNAWYYPNGNDLLNKPPGDDPTSGLKADVLPSRGVTTIGYAAVKTAGIRKKGDLTEADLVEVVQRHLDDLSKTASKLGVPREKLFTHAVGWKEGELLYGAGVNRFSCPGWSFYKHAKDPSQDIGVQAALKKSNAPYWAATEWLFQGGRETNLWRQALEKTLVDQRCRFVCIYNWDAIQNNDAALEAIRQMTSASVLHLK